MNITNCTLCDNCIKRKNIVSGYGNVNSGNIILLDQPRYKQDKTGSFIGDSDINTFLDFMAKVGLNENNAYFTNLVKCRSVSENYFQEALEICTTNHLAKEYRTGNKKKLMITVGKIVSKYILGTEDFDFFQPYRHVNIIIIPVYPVTAFTVSGKKLINKLHVIKKYVA